MSTKKEIVKEVSEKANLTQTEVKDIIQMTFDSILAALVRGEKVELRNFGVFMVKERAERRARNPRTGEEVVVPKKKVVIFRPGRMMDARIK
ncbi:MAG TPA: HU family DNA-binding protein [Planctomycetota bacterium]|nr:HU family DNA-binding protein [Planctomycetota bacterium]